MSKPKKDPRLGLASASGIDGFLACPGKFLLEKQVPEEERSSNADADSGTRIHEALETGDAAHLKFSESDIAVKSAEKEQEIFFRWKDEFQIHDAEISKEQRHWLTNSGAKVCSAKMDFYAISQMKRIALILDVKSGRNEVAPPPVNWQLRTGAVILFANFNLVHVRVGIVQPFQKAQPLCDYTAADLMNAWAKLTELLSRINDPKATRVTGPQCNYCAAKAICPEANALVAQVQSLAGMRWAALTPAKKLELWENGKRVSKIIEQIEKNIHAELSRDPDAIPGLVRKPDTIVREPHDLPAWLGALEARFPDADRTKLVNDFTAICSLGIGALTDLYRTYSGESKEQADTWINATGLITPKPKRGSVARVKEIKA